MKEFAVAAMKFIFRYAAGECAYILFDMGVMPDKY